MKKTGKNQERDLIEKTAKIYHSVAHDSMDGFWIMDVRGKFLDVNDVYCRMVGYNRKELLQMRITDVEATEKPRDVIKQIKHIKKQRKERYFTQHRKKDGTIIEIEISATYANYLGGLVFVSLRDITGTKKTENDQYRSRAASRKMIEGQLTDSYKHLGSINRKISLLLELERFPRSKKHSQEVIDHILGMAMHIANAPTGYLYGTKGRGKFNLLSYRGGNEGEREKIKVITSRKVGLLKHLLREKNLISGDIRRYEGELLALNNRLEYFVTLPLSKGMALGGFIFLGFSKKHSVSTQDLEFLDIFSLHASRALIKAGVLK